MRPVIALLLLALLCPLPAGSETLQGYIAYKHVDGFIGVRTHYESSIVYVHPQSPAEKAGVLAGDKILTVNGKAHNEHSIVGTPGTSVSLTVQRAGQVLTFVIERIDYREILP